MSEIVTINNDPDNILRREAEKISTKMIGSEELDQIIQKMQRGMLERNDSAAIAAPQVGHSLRVFVVSGKVLAMEKAQNYEEDITPLPDAVFIDPEIVKLSKETKILEEGCLSVPDTLGKVERSQKAKIGALDEEGNKIERGASGLLAEVFQHEIDHLNGILFIDRAKETYKDEEIFGKEETTQKI